MQTSRRSCWCHGNCITEREHRVAGAMAWIVWIHASPRSVHFVVLFRRLLACAGFWGSAALWHQDAALDEWSVTLSLPAKLRHPLIRRAKAIATCIDVFFWEHRSPLESCFFWIISGIISEEYLPRTDRVKNLLACSLHQKQSFLLSRQVTQYL